MREEVILFLYWLISIVGLFLLFSGDILGVIITLPSMIIFYWTIYSPNKGIEVNE